MEIGTKGTLEIGSDRYALQVVEKVNDKTFVAVHINDNGSCRTYGKHKLPWVEILRQKNDGEWYKGPTKHFRFREGEAVNYEDPEF